MEILELHELKPNEYNIEKLYRKNNKHYAVYLIQGERWQYPLSEKIIFRTFTRVWKEKKEK